MIQSAIIAALLWCLGIFVPAAASVTMINTRVVYPGDATERTIQLNNDDPIPSIVQVWVDSGDAASTPETADAPFVALPALFRIEPRSGQVVRLIYTGKDLPRDRESVFYLNIVQVPPKDALKSQQNHMTVILRNRLKLFYRPSGIEGRSDDVSKQLAFSLVQDGNKGRAIRVKNNSGYFASLASARLVAGTEELALNAEMVAPKSAVNWEVGDRAAKMKGPMKIKYTLINDYGAIVAAEAVVDIEGLRQAGEQ
ncbi:molecular chaperone [Jeongeupia sp. USM3]|uniref:fimbrial biogenesis chaperone n=1 Tax=Jeongeupia sp. USM3 TaxID=1906741 RepID=UPI00089DF237|nr:molecular chaperone [Jeongeupia sp. USM3]AOX99420.1 hypothetical protein BJP62_02480 [Jeongeupia sp. USM3]